MSSINPTEDYASILKLLLSMGFTNLPLNREAARKNNGILSACVAYLTENTQDQPAPPSSRTTSSTRQKITFEELDRDKQDLVDQCKDMGFGEEKVRKALAISKWKVEEAVQVLCEDGPELDERSESIKPAPSLPPRASSRPDVQSSKWQDSVNEVDSGFLIRLADSIVFQAPADSYNYSQPQSFPAQQSQYESGSLHQAAFGAPFDPSQYSMNQTGQSIASKSYGSGQNVMSQNYRSGQNVNQQQSAYNSSHQNPYQNTGSNQNIYNQSLGAPQSTQNYSNSQSNLHNPFQSTLETPNLYTSSAYQPQADPYSAFRNSNLQTTSVFDSNRRPSHNSPNVSLANPFGDNNAAAADRSELPKYDEFDPFGDSSRIR